MAFSTQAQRLANAPRAVHQRIAELEAKFGTVGVLSLTDITVTKAILDATAPFRAFLEAAGLHDYPAQGLGRVEHGVILHSRYLCLAEDGRAVASPVDVSLYRPQTGRGRHRRVNVLWGDGAKAARGDFLAFVSSLGGLFIVNVSHGIANGTDGANWESLIAVADEWGWPDPHDAIPGRRSSGKKSQGFARDVTLKVAIEKYAVRHARAHFIEHGALDVQVHGKPFDLLVSMKEGDLMVEVKGSVNVADTVFVTRGEIENVHGHHVALVVVDSIVCRKEAGDDWFLDGGRLRVWDDWTPEPESLEVVNYRHALGGAGDVTHTTSIVETA
jgi:hypothetical protein